MLKRAVLLSIPDHQNYEPSILAPRAVTKIWTISVLLRKAVLIRSCFWLSNITDQKPVFNLEKGLAKHSK
jgi:hypothetical protein